MIGKGYNHYRQGFDGGALKSGRAHVPAQLKPKKKPNSKNIQHSQKHITAASYDGGHLANSPLSMHSEMMAIRSALSLSAHDSGSSERSRTWCEKPCFKLPAGGRRKLRLQRVNEYVKAVCEEAKHDDGRIDLCSEGSIQGHEWRFEPTTRGFHQVQQQCPQEIQGEEGELEREEEEGEGAEEG